MSNLFKQLIPFLRISRRFYTKSYLVRNIYISKENNNQIKCYCNRFSSLNSNSIRISPNSLNLTSKIEDLFNYINNKEHRIYINIVEKFLNEINFDDLTEEQVISLLECCGKYVLSGNLESRNKVSQQIYEAVLENNKITRDICNTYIKICTENGVNLNHKPFLENLPFEADQNTYKTLLENVCEKGDTEQSVDILYLMKNKDIAADEAVFNALVLANSIKGGLKAVEIVRETMRSAVIMETSNTIFSIYKGLAIRNDSKEFEEILTKYPIKFDDDQFLKILEKLAVNDNSSLILKFSDHFDKTELDREFILKIDYLCLHLININHPESAMLIYKIFVEPIPEKRYGHFLLKEMLTSDIPANKIIQLAKDITSSELNQFALENITEVAFKIKKFDIARNFLQNLSILRPHYFWPLLIHAGNKDGEPGVLNVVKEMLNHKMNFDSETFENYILPYCKLNEPKLVIRNFQNLGFTIKQLLSPIILVLLQNGKLNSAYNLFQSYNVQLQNGKLLNALSMNLKTKNDIEPIIALLQNICEHNSQENDYVGEFLLKYLTQSNEERDFNLFLQLIKEMKKRKLRLNQLSADNLKNFIETNCENKQLIADIKDYVDSLQDFTLNNAFSYIPHPTNMSIEQLECHLIELKNKSMETRGILRKLIQEHTRLGNINRVTELRTEFINSGYSESAGVKSSIMYSFIQNNHLEHALNLFDDLKLNHPKFRIDEFKILDLVTLMVKNNLDKRGLDLIKEDTKNRTVLGGKAIEKNCWKLLGSYENDKNQIDMFYFLIKSGYCKPSNIILGPLIKIHLNKNNIEKATELYIKFANTYNCTPLQLEVLCAILDIDNPQLFEKAIEVTAKVYGKISAHTALVTALCEKGLVKPLRNFLLTGNQVSERDLRNRYERWVNEGKLDALKTLLTASKNVSKELINPVFLHEAIMKMYCANNDCEGALEFYENLIENEEVINKKLENILIDLLRSCKYEIPIYLRNKLNL